ncbi:MAG: SusD/RagB family nutrient-binding outer membrane lipoprotein [Gemmatimonadetes bacterium]|nr:SusD/RagB family nutrient-binding outer membrane lipoprotein [Gemmatimonadota bacterium]
MRHGILKGVVVAAMCAGIAACGDITSINTNPNGPTDVPPPSILSGVIQATVNAADGSGTNVRYGGLWVQYYSEIQYRDEDRYIVRPGVTGNWGLYNGALEDAQTMIDKGVNEDTPNWAAVGRIMKAYMYDLMTDAMGDLPYTEALKGSENLQPKYDSQQSIYTANFADLKQASDEIQPSGLGFDTGDLLYSGDMSAWRKFANSMRLRLAMHLANVDPGTAQSEAAAAVSAGVFTSNADNATLMYLSASPNQNPIYTNAISRDDYGMSKTFVDSLLSLSDPRLPIFADPNTATGAYAGLPNGLNDGEGPDLSTISRIGAKWRMTPAAPLALQTYSEVLFLEAEAAQRGWISGDPAALYAAGITASMEQYGISAADIATYLAQPRVQYSAATGLTQIQYQLWISLYMQGMEGWTVWRRTQVPHLVPGPRVVISVIPERLPYADNEDVLNKVNLEAAVAAQGLGAYTALDKPLWFTGRQ